MSLPKRALLFTELLLLTIFFSFEVVFGIPEDMIHQHEYLFIMIKFLIWTGILFLLNRIYIKKYSDVSDHYAYFTTLKSKNVRITCLMFIAALGINYIDTRFISIQLPENQQVINSSLVNAPILETLSLCFFGPTIEELLYRGVFYNLFFLKPNGINKIMKIVVSGIIFAFAHQFTIDLNWLIYCIMGWILGIAYSQTKELVYPILLHILINIF